MAVNPNTRVCTHIKVNGIRCGSPSLRQEVFCYFHQRMIRGVRTKVTSPSIANFEDTQAIQLSLMEVVNALLRNHIDVPRTRLILRAPSIAARNAIKTRFDCWQSEMVKEVPEYPAAPQVAGPVAIATAQSGAVTDISKPQENQSEHDGLSSAFQRTANAHRKPPASAKTTRRARAPRRRRTG